MFNFNEMYTDNTIMTFGKYKFHSLCRVPAQYLLQLHEQKYPNKELMQYIEDNMSIILAKKEGKIKAPILLKPCNKITYSNEKDAKFELKKIRQNIQEHKKPERCYECEKCGGWHLTSIPYERWEIIKRGDVK